MISTRFEVCCIVKIFDQESTYSLENIVLDMTDVVAGGDAIPGMGHPAGFRPIGGANTAPSSILPQNVPAVASHVPPPPLPFGAHVNFTDNVCKFTGLVGPCYAFLATELTRPSLLFSIFSQQKSIALTVQGSMKRNMFIH